jgi:glutathione S-transferase
MMILRTTDTSPFGRKPRMAALHLGLMDQIQILPADAMEADSDLRRENPLGKMPALTLADGRHLFDSRVILEHFDHLAGGGRIIPGDWDARMAALTAQALADGVMDAAVLVVYEGRYRPAELHHEPWLAYQRGKIERALAQLAIAPPDPNEVNVGTIATACMLGYLDWRKQVDWRVTTPSLANWLAAFRACCPAFDATQASGA